MAGRTKSRKKRSQSEISQYVIAICFVLLIVFSAAIYFCTQTGWFGTYVGGFFFHLFGITAFMVPPIVLALLLSIATHHFYGRLRSNLIYILAIFLCVSMLISVNDLPMESKMSTYLALAWERGIQLRGAGWIAGLLSYLVAQVIGRIGILLVTTFVTFFFVLHLSSLSLIEFFSMIGGWIASGVHHLRNRWQEFQKNRKKKAVRRRDSVEEARENRRQLPSVHKESTEVVTKDPSFSRSTNLEKDEVTSTPSDIEALNESIPIHRYNEPDDPTASKSRGKDVQVSKGLSLIREPEKTESKVQLDSQTKDQLSVATLGVDLPSGEIEDTYLTPPIELLKTGQKNAARDNESLKKSAEIIENTLASFGIEARVVSIQRGPTVTQFELKPQAGVKVSRITNLSDDLALALAAQDIRIEAPIPGKPYVGIEVPNNDADTVWLRDILQSDAFLHANEGLPVALGQSIDGNPVIAKIAKMPHLLIAGATGSGKSVCINTIILSILYKYPPSEVRLILIDPKVVELSIYKDIPHLLIPVVTDPKKASRALYLLVKEMERRFQLFSQYSVRDIYGYREQRKVMPEMENLPFIVLIIDELSDLMMVASKDVEAHITRLAQMARACGIHLIIATQRPSVDVITGTIKANIPSRISFAVSSSIDSRTILDQSGAEKLLGKGDMLYYPGSYPKPVRVQGAFISDSEVSQVVNYLTDQSTVHYDTDLVASIEKETSENRNTESEEPQDALMGEVIEFIRHEETTSISALQRRFRIGYARAGRIIDDLEKMGVISPQDGSKPREVYVHQIEEEEINESAQ